jgi:hypothetical protein
MAFSVDLRRFREEPAHVVENPLWSIKNLICPLSMDFYPKGMDSVDLILLPMSIFVSQFWPKLLPKSIILRCLRVRRAISQHIISMRLHDLREDRACCGIVP